MTRWRRIARKVLICVSAAAGIIVLLFVGLVVYGATDKEDTFLLHDAEFADATFLQRLAAEDPEEAHRHGNFSVYSHRLKRGTGTAIGFRTYSPGSFSVIDDESYRKITVWIANAGSGSSLEVPLGDDSRARLVVTQGGSAWPGIECTRVATAGFVRVEPLGKRSKVTIHADAMRAQPISSRRCAADGERLDLSFVAKEIGFDDLTPWLGREGRHPYDETYRRVWPSHAMHRTSKAFAVAHLVLVRY